LHDEETQCIDSQIYIIAGIFDQIFVEECMASRVSLVGIVVEICDETFHVDRRERAQPGNGLKRVLPLLGVCSLFFCHHRIAHYTFHPLLYAPPLSHTNQGNLTFSILHIDWFYMSFFPYSNGIYHLSIMIYCVD
jgi:hypothetical protein